MFGVLNLSRVGPARPYLPEPYAGQGGWRVQATEPGKLEVRSPKFERPDSASRYVTVHLSEPVRAEHLAQLRDDGFEPVGYVAYQNVVCRTRAGKTTRLGTVAPVLAGHKLAPELVGLDDAGPRCRSDGELVELVLSVWPGEQPEPVARTVADLGGLVEDVSARAVRFWFDPEQVDAVAGIGAVAWIQQAGRFEPFNRDVQWVMQVGWRPETPEEEAGRRVWHKGIRGQEMIVGLFDSGIHMVHEMFSDPRASILTTARSRRTSCTRPPGSATSERPAFTGPGWRPPLPVMTQSTATGPVSTVWPRTAESTSLTLPITTARTLSNRT